MSGIYVHIPFCKRACHYCNFHFSTSLKLQEEIVNAICKEITVQKSYLSKNTLETVYFGGGTPSILTESQLSSIMNTISSHFHIEENAEITLEANPDDLNYETLKSFKFLGINRLSIGVQSFFDSDLEWMNRSHNSHQSHQCIQDAYDVGFKNMSIDLIFGSPTTSMEQWRKNLDLARQYDISHLSCYGLTVEEGTALHSFIKKKKIPPLNESNALQQFKYTMKFLKSSGYTHYEISNYCLPGFEAKHNSNYWNQKEYLGVGPSAHSFNNMSRQWNVSNNVKYLKALTEGKLPYEQELLSLTDRFNEYIMTGLRTISGCHQEKLENISKEFYQKFISEVNTLIEKDLIIYENKTYTLTQGAKPIADSVISELFILN